MADTWILVADHARARLFSMNAGRMDEIGDFVNAAARVPGHERAHAPPSRVHDRFGDSRHAVQSHTLPRDKAATRFADALQSVLDRGRIAREYQNIVLIAPPRFLGVLNTAIGEQLGDFVTLRIAKNLTRRKPEAIRAELSSPFPGAHAGATGSAMRSPG